MTGGTFFLENGYVVASIMVAKYKALGEKFVTWKELNYVTNELQKIFNEKDINVCVVTSIDAGHFNIGLKAEVITLNNSSVETLERIYNVLVPRDISKILWNHKLICQKLYEFRKEEVAILEQQ